MKPPAHVLIGSLVGALASLLPDGVLALYRWRGELHPQHPFAIAHRFMHSWNGLLFIAVLSYAVHLLVDWFTHQPHLYLPAPDVEEWFENELSWRATHKRRT